jgi:hypothetical protein
MKKIIKSISFLLLVGISLMSCSKKETLQNEKVLPFSNLYKNGGVVHNELLSVFLDSVIKNDFKLSQKIKTIVSKYHASQKSKGDIKTIVMSYKEEISSDEFVRLRDEINAVVADEVIPTSISYLEQNGYYNEFYSIGINNPQIFISDVVDGIYNNAAFSNDQYINQLISTNSANFQNFVPALKSLIETDWLNSGLSSKIDSLKYSYLSQTSDPIEALAIINGCETAKSSFTYWNDPVNATNWDAAILYSFNSGTFSNQISSNAIINRNRTEVIVSDAVGAVVGVIEGARIGAAAGPGGAMIVGVTGMILRGAHASLSEYTRGKIFDWLGW